MRVIFESYEDSFVACWENVTHFPRKKDIVCLQGTWYTVKSVSWVNRDLVKVFVQN